ncbi:uncharacterized protein N7511_006016 [Penicillium nucicola]|uniref:uncharacterized protein n=1 Tax=Penicillium nucicola TaxID=1850975 RepID=UPI0025453FA7|nr:uncharacterized protein N7511_006016 [Penicillium nucicola]KAJ5757322.1 hypothetical protein N7511_006016 [Penicillium nucicola]
MGEPGISHEEMGLTNNPAVNRPETSNLNTKDTYRRYDSEREKRLRPEGFAQYVELDDTADMYPAERIASNDNLIREETFRVLIVGAGFGGLLFAVRLLQTGFCQAHQILLVDKAGGFGGTWWWNRYPGLTCDVESYIYMPLLEEMNYMPSHKYVSGNELREHAKRIADRWRLTNRGLFGTKVDRFDWSDEETQWSVQVTTKDHAAAILKSEFVILAGGLLDSPKRPKLNGLDTYQGHVFHTSRWDYAYTGGSPENPIMSQLCDKTVGFVGTGATAVQAVPHLAQWAKKLIVFQRTPSSVDVRDNSVTDPTWWETMTQEKGPKWQRERMENFNSFVSNDTMRQDVNMVNDAWSQMPSFSALIGSPKSLQPDYLAWMQSLDINRQGKIRHRVEATVTDPATSQLLKPWYPGWCKRPCFSDNFLQAFNKPNVKLIDTEGKGVQTVSDRGIVVDGRVINLDAIIFGTGYSLGSNTACEHVPIIGRDQKTLKQKREEEGMASLHGIMSSGFPNLFFPGPYQAGASPNQVYVLDQLAIQVAYIISAAGRGSKIQRFMVVPSSAAEEGWTKEVLLRARALEGVANCTPGYWNREGARLDEKETFKAARFCIWGQGIKDYVDHLEHWRRDDRLDGLEIQHYS